MKNPTEEYIAARDEQVRVNMEDRDLRVLTERFFAEMVRSNYGKNFTFTGVPILQLPTDLMVIQELIWNIQPDVVIESGIAFGGGLLFYASVLEVIGKGKVLGIDIDPRDHNMKVLEKHPLRHRISVVKGSSIDKKIIEATRDYCRDGKVMVILDSCHSADHVLQELRLYAPLVSVGSYVIVMDTAIEFFFHFDRNQDRPWKPGNSPYSAVQEFMKGNDEFVVDKEVEQRTLLTAAPGGWLRRVK
uniref:Putative cephalosporin hydroxylase n=1 Tax=viral metagenome TaxID=1070528 RepID=A0A6M3IW21_9ZZZZ